jgi:hypothetical protein
LGDNSKLQSIDWKISYLALVAAPKYVIDLIPRFPRKDNRLKFKGTRVGLLHARLGLQLATRMRVCENTNGEFIVRNWEDKAEIKLHMRKVMEIK